jgi:hypothetical protein
VLPRARLEVARFRARRRAVLARLKRVNLALAAWDEWDAAQAMPAEVRLLVPRPGHSAGRRWATCGECSST